MTMLKKISIVMLVLMVLTGVRIAWLLHANPVAETPLYHVGDTVNVYHSQVTVLDAKYLDEKVEVNSPDEWVKVELTYRIDGEQLEFAPMAYLRAGNSAYSPESQVKFLGNNIVSRKFSVRKKFIKEGQPLLLHIESHPNVPKDVENQPPFDIDLSSVLKPLK